MAEPGGWDVGTVEDEAHRLIEAAGGWWRSQQGSSDGNDPTGRARGTHGCTAASAGTDESGTDASSAEDSGTGARSATADEPAGCTACPWCRAKAAFGPIGADTFDSLAELLEAAALSLRLLAHNRRAEAESAAAAAGEDHERGAEGRPAQDGGPGER